MSAQECADYTYGNNCTRVCNCMIQCEVCDKVPGACLTGHPTHTQSTGHNTGSANSEYHPFMLESRIRPTIEGSLFAVACVTLAVLAGMLIKLKREFNKYKVKKEERYAAFGNRDEISMHDVITDSHLRVNTTTQNSS